MTPGQTAYEAYREDSGGKSLISGAEIPAWEKLPTSIQHAWETAAEKVLQEFR